MKGERESERERERHTHTHRKRQRERMGRGYETIPQVRIISCITISKESQDISLFTAKMY